MIITRDNVHARVTSCSDEEQRWLAAYLTMPGRGLGQHWSLMSRDNRFAAGMLPVVRRAARAAGHAVELVDRRPPAPRPDLSALDRHAWARDYQLEAARVALARERGIIKWPMAGGKGLLPILLASCVDATWLYVVHRTQLALDVAGRWREHTGEVAMVIVADSDGARELRAGTDVFPRLVCATYSMLLSLYKSGEAGLHELFDAVVGVVADECHTAAAAWNNHLLSRLARARYRIGCSATSLDRSDRRDAATVGALGPVIHEMTNGELVERRVVSKCRAHMVPLHQEYRSSEPKKVYDALVVRSARRNRVLVDAALSCQKPALLFVKLLDHGEILERLLVNAGVPARFVWGRHSIAWREAAARDLVAGRLEVVVTNKIWHEGINILALRTIMVGGGGASVIETLQRPGRGARVVEGEKYHFDLWDILDQGQEWLERHARKRLAAYRREGYEVDDGS